jgi:polyvinyl alcohol dehydrogenase (cytochrome)
MRFGMMPFVAASVIFAWCSARAQSVAPSQNPQENVFQQNCMVCHGNPATRAPTRASLQRMSPEFIVEALTSGIMRAQGAALSPDQRVSLAEYLTGQKIGARAPMEGRCNGTPPEISLNGPSFNGWGANLANWRYQNDPGISASQLEHLELKWAFGMPGAATMFGQPTIAAGRVFVGGQNGHVYSLNAQSGCYYWDYAASTGVRTAITVAQIGGRNVVFFGDRRGHVYSVDALTGEMIWKVTPDDAPATQVTGAPVLFEDRLYVPISVGDDSRAVDPKYECCQGRGAIAALNAATGDTIWKTYTLPEAVAQGRNQIGTQLWGPSGASTWASPTIDEKRRILYAGTGDNHSAPATETSDAVLAVSLDTGKILWSRQLLAGDMGNGACYATDKTNCPQPHGPDFDRGTSANLIPLQDGKCVLVIGQKSGMIWGLDPDDNGRVIWQTRVGQGGVLGGVQWGTATDGKTVYAAVSDMGFIHVVLGQPIILDPDKGGGLHALAAATGATLWTAPPARACADRKNCSPAQSGAVTATPEYVLSGSADGHVRAYATTDGKVLWDYDTVRSFTTVNNVKASGGSLDSGGPTVAGGMIYVNSGYGLYGGQPGNLLLAFAPAGR